MVQFKGDPHKAEKFTIWMVQFKGDPQDTQRLTFMLDHFLRATSQEDHVVETARKYLSD